MSSGKFGFIPVKECYMDAKSGINNLMFSDLTVDKDEICEDMETDREGEINEKQKSKIEKKMREQMDKKICRIQIKSIEKLKIQSTNFLWLYGKRTDKNIPGWFGFMEKYHQFVVTFEISKVIPLPFVNAPPSEYGTIFTVLIEAAAKAKTHDQKHVCVTFDQPLYWNARDILASINVENDPYNLKSIILVIGGFHALMSYLGSIGFIMEGSGLKEAFCTIYAEGSAEKALTGHAYSRAVRAHVLLYTALANILFEELEFTEAENQFLEESLKKVGQIPVENLKHNKEWLDILNKFEFALSNIEKRGPTSKLWVQYFRMVTIMLHYINAQRCGIWDEHLECLELMLPFFHASGHNLFAKSTHVFLQDMKNLKTIMDPTEFQNLTSRGYFTIRRTNKFWVGVWSDMTIEQVLMRSMKCIGGLTHGRGLTESVRAKWIACTVATIEVCNNMETFCGASFSTSEQHVDTRISRIERDNSDLKKVTDFFAQFNPFPVTNDIRSIYSGAVGDT